MSEPRDGLHIGYLVQQFSPEVGAGPARVSEMAREWLRRGARVTVYTAMPNRPEGRIHAAYRGRLVMQEDWQGIRTLRSWVYASPKHGFSRTILNNASFMATSALTVLRPGSRPDVLIASSPPFFPHLTGWMAHALRRVPLVLELRDLWPDYLVGMGTLRDQGLATRALFGLERAVLRRADAVAVVTESFRRRVVAKGVDASRVEVLPNGVDTEFYRRAADPPPLPALARRDGEFLVGYLGNFGAGQALEQVVDAAALLAREGRPVRFVLAGDGPQRAQVEAHAAAVAPPNLTLHPPIPKADTRAFYTACDACLVPLAPVAIFQETVPSKIFEVMACEVPVVASLDGEGRAIVEQAGAGLVCEPGNPRSLADALLALRSRPSDERARMGALGRRYVGEHYSRSAIAERYFRLLQRTAHGRSAAVEQR